MTVDLRTGTEYPPRREDYCTKQTAVAPAPPGMPCPMWMAFLNRITNNNDALIGFLQRLLGYFCTGHVHEHVIVFLYGTGSNGKTVFVETVAGIFGDYCIAAPMEMFLAAKYERHPTEIARLKGARLVIAQETAKGRFWDEAKIKNLTGGGTLSGRFMRGDWFDFKPTHKILIGGNYKPSLRNVDEAIRRRFLLVPFTVLIPPAERDPKLAEKLKAEWRAILRWMVNGCLQWRRVGLVVPTVVRDATEQYLADQDVMKTSSTTRTPSRSPASCSRRGSSGPENATSPSGPRQPSPTASPSAAMSGPKGVWPRVQRDNAAGEQRADAPDGGSMTPLTPFPLSTV
jgi:putative DNA primase/helicase